MTSDAILVRRRREPMSPVACLLAILLHVLIGMAVWAAWPLRPAEPKDETVMVMFDASPSNAGLQAPVKPGPPAESEAASPPSSAEPERQIEQALAPPRPSIAPEPSRPDPPRENRPEAEPVPSLPLYEFSIPPPPVPPPAPTSRDFARPRLPVAPPPRPVQRTQPLPPRYAPPAQQRPPTDSPAAMPSPLPGPNPADLLAGRGRQRNDYLTRIFRHLEPYRFYPPSARDNRQGGRVVTRVTIARDGGLIDARIDISSGWPALDSAELAAIRKAAPFPPVPKDMPGDPVILILRMNYPGR